MAELARLYPWLEAAAGALPERLRHDMHVALEEAVVNVAMHGLPPGDAHGIEVRLLLDAAAAELVVEDRGPAFDPLATPEQPREGPGGLGLRLLRRFCPEPSYRRLDGRNRLSLRFPLR